MAFRPIGSGGGGGGGGAVASVAGKTGVVTLVEGDVASLVSDLAAKAPTASPTFTGTVAGVSKSAVGLGNVLNIVSPEALNGITGVWVGTAAQYAAVGTPVSTVLYAVTA